jgi:hypothetical protein
MTTVLPNFSSYKSSLYRQRQKNYPEIPETASDVNLEGKWTETLDSSRFLLHHDRQSNIIIFASDHMLRLIADADTLCMDGTFSTCPRIFYQLFTINIITLYMDGTFSTCPRIFYQLFTINIIVDGKQVPALYALLPSKSRETYNKMFTSIKEQMQNLNFTLPPSIVLIDFEIALRQSVQLQFPVAYIKGCYFHFTQCLYRWIQTHGLAIDYRESTSNIRTFVSNCAALAFLPPANVRLAFASVSGAQDHTVPSVQQFSTYFQQTWLRDFPIVIWNHCETTSERTNNRLEGGTTISTDLQADPIPTSTN